MVFSCEFPARRAYPTVTVRLTNLEVRSASPRPPRTIKRSPAKKRPSSARPTRRRKPERRVRKAGRRSPARRLPSRKQTRTQAASKKKKKEEILKERLASLRRERLLRERIAALEKKLKKESAGGGEAPENGEKLSSEYVGLFRTHLQSFWDLPLALKKKRGLYAVVRIRLSAEGNLLNYELVKPSGNVLFDRAVLAAVKAAAPYPAPGTPVTIRAVFRPEGPGF